MVANKYNMMLDFYNLKVNIQTKNLKSTNFQANFQATMGISSKSYETTTTDGACAATTVGVNFLMGLKMASKMSLFSSKAMHNVAA